jgi:predicted phosphohydrolase
MKLYVLSDVHLESGDFEVPRVDADAVIIAGDLHVGVRGLAWAAERLPDVPILYVLGNHEYYHESIGELGNQMRATAAEVDDRIKVLDRTEFELNGVVFLGATLWTDFGLAGDRIEGMAQAWEALTDFWVIRTGLDRRRLEPEDVLSIHNRDLQWLEQSLAKHVGARVVVVTHHPPSASSVPAPALLHPWSSVYASRLDHVVESSGANLWVHGHIHAPVDYMIGRTRVLSNPRGYANRGAHWAFRPDLTVEV